MARILVADDDDLLCELVRFKLEAIGHEVDIVEDGEAAWNILSAKGSDLLILDSMMPVMSGPELLQKIRRDVRLNDMPVIMLTARKSQDDVTYALRQGASDYLTKPFMPDELVLRVSSLLSRRGGEVENAELQ